MHHVALDPIILVSPSRLLCLFVCTHLAVKNLTIRLVRVPRCLAWPTFVGLSALNVADLIHLRRRIESVVQFSQCSEAVAPSSL